MSEYDSKGLSLARQVVELTSQKHIGGDVQLLAKIQCLFVEAMEYAAPRADSPVWVGVDWAEGCKPSISPEIPEGWKLVPVEPTENMVIQGFESEPDEFFSKDEDWEIYQHMSGCEQAAHRAKLCWAAMLASAPGKEG